MRLHHTERLTESVTRLAAEFLGRRRGQALVTVTGTRLGQSGCTATIFVTVYPVAGENKALAETRIWRNDLRDFLGRRLRGSPLIHIDFALDARNKT